MEERAEPELCLSLHEWKNCCVARSRARSVMILGSLFASCWVSEAETFALLVAWHPDLFGDKGCIVAASA